MPKILFTVLAVGSLFLASHLQAGLTDVQITVTKSADKADKVVEGEGGSSKLASEVSHDIKLADTAFADLSDLTVDYIIFVERQKIGTKKEQDVVKRIKGTKAIPALTKKEPQTISTEKILLSTESLVGNYIYSNGARIKVMDNIKGVWVRVSQGGKVIAEYLNPSTVRNRGWDEK